MSVHCNTRYNYRPPPSSYYQNYPQNYYQPQHYHGHYHQFHQPYYNRRPRQGMYICLYTYISIRKLVKKLVNFCLILGDFYYDDGENIHVNRDQLVRGAAFFGAGLLKGVIVSALINQSNSGITIGWNDFL